MRKSRFGEAQIIGMIKEQEAGLPRDELCRKHGLSPATFYKLKAKYGGMDLSDAKRLKQLELSVGRQRFACKPREAANWCHVGTCGHGNERKEALPHLP